MTDASAFVFNVNESGEIFNISGRLAPGASHKVGDYVLSRTDPADLTPDPVTGQTALDIALTTLVAHSLGNETAFTARHAKLILNFVNETSADAILNKIAQWGRDRNIIGGATSKDQLPKLMEELGEMAGGIARKQADAIMDGIGDTIVVLSMIAGNEMMSIRDCIDTAYTEIKDRKGVLLDGTFIKSTDLEAYHAAMVKLGRWHPDSNIHGIGPHVGSGDNPDYVPPATITGAQTEKGRAQLTTRVGSAENSMHSRANTLEAKTLHDHLSTDPAHAPMQDSTSDRDNDRRPSEPPCDSGRMGI